MSILSNILSILRNVLGVLRNYFGNRSNVLGLDCCFVRLAVDELEVLEPEVVVVAMLGKVTAGLSVILSWKL